MQQHLALTISWLDFEPVRVGSFGNVSLPHIDLFRVDLVVRGALCMWDAADRCPDDSEGVGVVFRAVSFGWFAGVL